MSAQEMEQKPCYQMGLTLNATLKVQDFRARGTTFMQICKLYKKPSVSMPFSESAGSMHRWTFA